MATKVHSQLDLFDDEADDTEEEDDEIDENVPIVGLKRSTNPSNGDVQGEETEADGPVADELVKKKKVKTSKPFSEEMLAGRDGLVRIYEEFPHKNLFRGRGFEAQDLKRVIKIYKEWAFQLYPGLAFSDLLGRCEVFGSKGKTRSCAVGLRDRERNRYTHEVLGVPITQLRGRSDGTPTNPPGSNTDDDGPIPSTSPEARSPLTGGAGGAVARGVYGAAGSMPVYSNHNHQSTSSSSSSSIVRPTNWALTEELDDDALLLAMDLLEQSQTQSHTQVDGSSSSSSSSSTQQHHDEFTDDPHHTMNQTKSSSPASSSSSSSSTAFVAALSSGPTPVTHNMPEEEKEVGADDGNIYLDSDSDDEEDGHRGFPGANHLLSQESSTSLSPSQRSNNPIRNTAAAVGFDSQAMSPSQDDEDLMDDGPKNEVYQGPELDLVPNPSMDVPEPRGPALEEHLQSDLGSR